MSPVESLQLILTTLTLLLVAILLQSRPPQEPSELKKPRPKIRLPFANLVASEPQKRRPVVIDDDRAWRMEREENARKGPVS